MVRRLGLTTVLWLTLASLAPPACGQSKDFEAAESLYAAYELARGGRPLFETLFDRGWPTDAAHEKVTVRLGGETADLLVGVYLASGAGLPLSASDYQLARKERLIKAGEDGASISSILEKDLRVFRSLTDFEQSARGFSPIFMPYKRSRADLRKPWNEEDILTWAWKTPREQQYTLEGLGFAMLAEATFARDQLTHKREVEQQGRQVEFVGRTARDGFFAFVALQSAAAKLWELRHQLILDLEDRKLTARTTLRGLNPKSFCFPIGWTVKVSGGTAQYTLTDADDRLKSRLRAQAAVLLGAAELADLSSPDASETLTSLWEPRNVAGKPVQIFPQDMHAAAVEAATFAFQSISKLHVSVKGSGRASSTADHFEKGGTITPTDLGLFLMAIEAFINKVHLPSGGRGKPDPEVSALQVEQGKARTLITELSKMIQAWQQNQPGLFYDSYSVRNSTRQVKTRSLESQAFAIRGLLATHLALKAGADSTYLVEAKAALARLDAERWDTAKQAYLEENGKATLFGAAAVLGALRELSLVSNDGRYLTRYRQYMESLQKREFIRDAKGDVAPGLLSEVEFE